MVRCGSGAGVKIWTVNTELCVDETSKGRLCVPVPFSGSVSLCKRAWGQGLSSKCIMGSLFCSRALQLVEEVAEYKMTQ